MKPENAPAAIAAETPPRFAIIHSETYYAAGTRSVARGPALALHCSLGQCRDRKPLVTLQDMIGSTGDYRPDDLRAIAAKLLAMAEDADAQPTGKRSFLRSYRRY